ncbi:TPA: hypothetical protein N0F65_007768 [Lagenidium giganteum]|uniref:Reverse transcriptase n=1 Tax=Lagenidium giganteum TaxID=4803 RepID=A0AAV2YPM2_9STRA|nr:TPA: hypothetical protein N0F65_007768 [Lagenidium giganteum]
MANSTAEDGVEAYLENVFSRWGAQEVVRNDRDPRFLGAVLKRFNRMMRQKQRAYRPQANGKQERYVQTVMSTHAKHGSRAFYLVHGWDARTELDAMLPPLDRFAREFDALRWRNRVVHQHQYAMAHAAEIQKCLMEETARQHNEEVEARQFSTTRTS